MDVDEGENDISTDEENEMNRVRWFCHKTMTVLDVTVSFVLGVFTKRDKLGTKVNVTWG